MSTYLTSAEATLFYPFDANYSAGQKSAALATSYGLVNGYLSADIKIPSYSSEGNAPEVLKIIQLKFYTYILETSNEGQTDELQQLYDGAVEMCRAIQQHELFVPEAQQTPLSAGWTLNSITTTDGKIFLRGANPDYYSHLTFLFLGDDNSYAGAGVGTFSVTDYNTGTSIQTLTIATTWQNITGTNLEVCFGGVWDADDTFVIVGVPYDTELPQVSTTQMIKTQQIWY